MATQFGLWQVRAVSRYRFGQPEDPESAAFYKSIGYGRAKRAAARARYRRGLLRHAYDSQARADNDQERASRRAIEAPQRARCGIGRLEQWPAYFWPGGYDAVYYVADDVDSARRGSVDGRLCAQCLNGDFAHNVVVAVGYSAECDQPEYCNHCGRNVGAEEEEEEEVCAECGTATPDEADSAAPFARTRYGPLCETCREAYERDGRADWL